jgi:hypothetical protein
MSLLGKLTATTYELAFDAERGISTELVRMRQRDGSILWAVRCLGEVLNHRGEWEHEPLPSSRDGDFMRRCRFASADLAITTHGAAEPRFVVPR